MWVCQPLPEVCSDGCDSMQYLAVGLEYQDQAMGCARLVGSYWCQLGLGGLHLLRWEFLVG